jgi:hypothetical protein
MDYWADPCHRQGRWPSLFYLAGDEGIPTSRIEVTAPAIRQAAICRHVVLDDPFALTTDAIRQSEWPMIDRGRDMAAFGDRWSGMARLSVEHHDESERITRSKENR